MWYNNKTLNQWVRLLVVLIAFCSLSVECLTTVSLSQNIQKDFCFTSQNQYLITDSIFINGTLSIEAGVTVLMASGVSLTVYNGVYAVGNDQQPITFRMDYLSTAPWGVLSVYANSTTPTIFEKVTILSGGYNGKCQLTVQGGSSFQFQNNEISRSFASAGLCVSGVEGKFNTLEIYI
jgi:hypothetical protein